MGDGEREGAASGPSSTETHSFRKGHMFGSFTGQLPRARSQRETSPSQAGSCSGQVGAAPGGQGSSRAGTVRHVSDEKQASAVIPCHVPEARLSSPEWSFKNELREPG